MFSTKMKQEISDKIQEILRETNHRELPKDEIQFELYVDGAEDWSWAIITNNGEYNGEPGNLFNELNFDEK